MAEPERHSGTVLAVAESDRGGALRPVSWEMVTAGRAVADAIGGPLVALLFGSGVGDAAGLLGAAGADRVLCADDPGLANANSEAASAVLVDAIAAVRPSVVLIPGTTLGRDYAPRVAARLRAGLAADAVALAVDGDALVATRPVFGGRVQTEVRLRGPGARLVTVHPGSFPAASPQDGVPQAIEGLTVALGDLETRVRVRDTVAAASGPVDLDRATIVVGGGRGLKEAGNFGLVEELATSLDGVVGATRAVTDAGWRPHHEQIGQTGRTVAPRLYVAVGVSGAIQHLVGIQGSDYIVAINRDPDAPIFKIASFGIVGDLFEVVPALIDELKP